MMTELFLAATLFLASTPAEATKPAKAPKPTPVDLYLDPISVIATPEALPRVAGSAQVLDAESLNRFKHSDVERVLKEAPGVYTRGEDGYGLRPNIGLRGANSDRSAKITLLEDGVLLAPAPYAAPAAYYFPLMTRITGVEVFKGPASIRHGPNTIGGALNLQSRQMPLQSTGFLDVGYGMERFGRAHGFVGTAGQRWSVLLEGDHLRSDGFKDLDNGDDTGFGRNDIVLRGRYHTDANAKLYQQFDMQLGYGDEVSHETYLGLADADFDQTPYRRYAASQLGLMEWQRTQLRADHILAWGDDFDIRTTLYRHDFSRDWRKLNGFRGGPDLNTVLRAPTSGQNAVYYAILRGAEDSSTDNETLLLGTNARTFVSQGIATKMRADWHLQGWQQSIEVGLRFHQDSIVRTHTEDGHHMRSGALVRDATPTATTVHNRGAARAWALHLQDQITWGKLLVAPGLRFESIHTDFHDRQTDQRSSASDHVWLPGVGLHYQLTPWMGVLAGVHRGFSPVAPGQPDAVNPEDSLNYEAGARLGLRQTQAELIGFFNDYDNLTGECTFSTGCDEDLLNRQFNGGQVYVYGLEASLEHRKQGLWGMSWLWKGSYTFTLSSFQSSFASQNPQFGMVEEGDRLPYVPIHQASLLTGLSWAAWDMNLSLAYVGAMRDVAGQGPIPSHEEIPAQWVVDAATEYQLFDTFAVYLTVKNLFNRAYITSRRPFGVRPGRPFQALAGLKVTL